jgi:hypothetical protein
MRLVVVELDTGEQECFDTTYEAFKYARKQETVRPHSVEFVAIGEFQTADDHVVYRGNELRILLRSLDNVEGWLTAGYDGQVQSMDS